MDPPYQPANITFQNSHNFDNGIGNSTNNARVHVNGTQQSNTRNEYPNGPQYHSREQSGQTSRTGTWVESYSVPYPRPEPEKQMTYFQGSVDTNGFPIDAKGKQAHVEARSVQPTPRDSPRESMDLEKQDKMNEMTPKHDPHKKDPNQPHLPLVQRLRHFTWAWYTLTMATGGISTLIAIQPHSFPGLITIGAVFYIVNLVFFTTLNSLMVFRFCKFPGSLKESICHEREALFLGPFFLSVATIITGTQKYVVESYEVDHPTRAWITSSMAIVFWVYVFMTFCLAVFQYSYLFAAHSYQVVKFMPSWLLPIFPIMLAGTVASVIAKDQPISSRMPMIAAGLGCQGLGFTVSILMYAHYIGRLMQAGFPNREHRGAMFIGVGPPSFTCLAFIGMANALPDDIDFQGDGLFDAHVLRTMALVSALFLWVLAMWFFMIALIAVSLNTLHPHTPLDSR
jgi:tellurite resistance protein TehA-like permease